MTQDAPLTSPTLKLWVAPSGGVWTFILRGLRRGVSSAYTALDFATCKDATPDDKAKSYDTSGN